MTEIKPKTDAELIRAEAEAEVREEKFKAAKAKIKELLKKRDAAKLVYENIEREINDALALIDE